MAGCGEGERNKTRRKACGGDVEEDGVVGWGGGGRSRTGRRARGPDGGPVVFLISSERGGAGPTTKGSAADRVSRATAAKTCHLNSTTSCSGVQEVNTSGHISARYLVTLQSFPVRDSPTVAQKSALPGHRDPTCHLQADFCPLRQARKTAGRCTALSGAALTCASGVVWEGGEGRWRVPALRGASSRSPGPDHPHPPPRCLSAAVPLGRHGAAGVTTRGAGSARGHHRLGGRSPSASPTPPHLFRAGVSPAPTVGRPVCVPAVAPGGGAAAARARARTRPTPTLARGGGDAKGGTGGPAGRPGRPVDGCVAGYERGPPRQLVAVVVRPWGGCGGGSGRRGGRGQVVGRPGRPLRGEHRTRISGLFFLSLPSPC